MPDCKPWWAAATPGWKPTAPKRRKTPWRYGLSEEDYLAMVEAQAGHCLLCGRIPDSGLQIDHDHATGRVRGLLCIACNTGLGHFRDDADLMRRAADYVSEPDTPESEEGDRNGSNAGKRIGTAYYYGSSNTLSSKYGSTAAHRNDRYGGGDLYAFCDRCDRYLPLTDEPQVHVCR